MGEKLLLNYIFSYVNVGGYASVSGYVGGYLSVGDHVSVGGYVTFLWQTYLILEKFTEVDRNFNLLNSES